MNGKEKRAKKQRAKKFMPIQVDVSRVMPIQVDVSGLMPIQVVQVDVSIVMPIGHPGRPGRCFEMYANAIPRVLDSFLMSHSSLASLGLFSLQLRAAV
jgi:hypothetical protein